MPSSSAAASTIGLERRARLPVALGGEVELGVGPGPEEVAPPDHGLHVAGARVDRDDRGGRVASGRVSTLATASSATQLPARVERGVHAQPAAEHAATRAAGVSPVPYTGSLRSWRFTSSTK